MLNIHNQNIPTPTIRLAASQTLPSNKRLLEIADIILNKYYNRRYDTVAVGAIGTDPFHVHLVVGINSSSSHMPYAMVAPDRSIPDRIKYNVDTLMTQLTFIRHPYHAETGIVIEARERGFKIFGLASSRKICDICIDLIKRYSGLFERLSDTEWQTPVDAWQTDGNLILTDAERTRIFNPYRQ